MNATAMAASQSFMIEFHAQAKRFLKERGRYNTASADEFEKLVEYFRWHAFRKETEPYEKQRAKILTDFFSYQSRPPAPAQMPKELREAIAAWDSMILSVAIKFGYSQAES